MNKRLALLALLLGITHQAISAPDLIDIYRQSLNSDPIFKQAYNTYLSTKEVVPQATAQLLPTVFGSANTTKIDYNSKNVSALFGVQSNYRQWDYTISLSQPVFNYAAWMGERQASHIAKQAQATFNSQAQDLMLRTATAYFTVLQARDNLRFAEAKKRANYRQYDQANQRFKVGLDPITSVYEAQAAYDASRAQVISSRNNLINQRENLRKLTNRTYKRIAPLRNNNVPLIKPKPANVDTWVDGALKQNYLLIAAKFAKLASKSNISIQNAGHLPTLNFNASYNKTDSNSSSAFLGSVTKQGTFGLSLNLPLFQGGLVLSQTKQAVYDYRVSQEQYESTYRDTLVNTRIAYNTITDGISTIRADRQALKSSMNSLESTEAQFKVGTRTMVDVVTAQQNLFQVQTQLAIDQYNYILAILQLKYLAGILSVPDLAQINSWLVTTKRYK